MVKMKKLIAGLLTGVMLVGVLSGCGGGNSVAGKEDPSKYPEEPYEINWYTQGDTQSDVASVEAAINEITKKEINATVRFNILGSAQYAKKMQTMIAAGESFDIAFMSASVLNYFSTLKSGALFDYGPYMDEYMPKTKALFPEEFLNSAYNENGIIGAVPCYKELAQSYGWVYNKDIADKYGIDMTKIKTLEELEPYLEKIKAGEPDMKYPMEWDSSLLNQNLISYAMPSVDATFILDENGKIKDGGAKIFPETEEFKALAETARRFYEKGLVKPDTLTASDAKARFKQGKSFVIISGLKPGACNEMFPDVTFEVAQSPVTPVYLNAPTGSMLAISATSKNPYRVMRFIELLYNNKELSNLVVYGIEDKHYTKVGENTIKKIENSGYDMSAQQWMLGNVFNNYLLETDIPDKYEQFEAFNKSAKAHEAYGFVPNLDSVELQTVSVSGVKSQYRNQALLGSVEPGAVIEEYIKKLKEAGIEDIIAEVNKQFAEFQKK